MYMDFVFFPFNIGSIGELLLGCLVNKCLFEFIL